MLEELLDRMPKDLPNKMSEDMPEDMPDRMSRDMTDRRYARYEVPDRMSEDMPDIKCKIECQSFLIRYARWNVTRYHKI